MFPPARLPYSLPHPRMRGPGSAPSDKVEPRLALAAVPPPAAAVLDLSDLVAQVKVQSTHFQRGAGSIDRLRPCAPVLAPDGCRCLSAVYIAGTRPARRLSLWRPEISFLSCATDCLSWVGRVVLGGSALSHGFCLGISCIVALDSLVCGCPPGGDCIVPAGDSAADHVGGYGEALSRAHSV